jgi:lysophospholipase L1-like esterase
MRDYHSLCRRANHCRSGALSRRLVLSGDVNGWLGQGGVKPGEFLMKTRIPNLFVAAICLAGVVLTAKAGGFSNPAQEMDPQLRPVGRWGFRPAPDTNSQLPRVLLIGDSIVGGYGERVITNLNCKARVDVWQTGLCESSKELHPLLRKVLAYGPYAVIHFNIGLHGWQKGRIPDGQYEPLMQEYVAILRQEAPQARLIWASTTPVTVKGAPGQLDPGVNLIIVERNAIAARIMTEHNIAIDDLYGLMAGKLSLAVGDQFHWKPAGQELQSKAVAAIISKYLPVRAAPDAGAPGAAMPGQKARP